MRDLRSLCVMLVALATLIGAGPSAVAAGHSTRHGGHHGAASSDADDRPQGQICGGVAGLRCPSTQFCDMSHRRQGAGVCRPSPTACPRLYQPVCGADRHTYPNACTARAAHTRVAHEGVCIPTVGRGRR